MVLLLHFYNSGEIHIFSKCPSHILSHTRRISIFAGSSLDAFLMENLGIPGSGALVLFFIRIKNHGTLIRPYLFGVI